MAAEKIFPQTATPQIITPEWSAPADVVAASTTRIGGCSKGVFAGLNVGTHVGDCRATVEANRRLLARTLKLPVEPYWLEQVHGTDVLYLPASNNNLKNSPDKSKPDGNTVAATPVADASWTDQPGTVLAVMTADCLPVLVASRCGRFIAAVHGGWRGLAAGILQKTVAALPVPAAELVAWMGPAIGPQEFEVGLEVRSAFIQQGEDFAPCFEPSATDHDKCYANIFSLAELCLNRAGVQTVQSDRVCTASDKARFFSHRRDRGQSGRMVTLIWRK